MRMVFVSGKLTTWTSGQVVSQLIHTCIHASVHLVTCPTLHATQLKPM